MSSDSDGLDVPLISTEQMREVDRAMIEDYGILLIQMMENAGRDLAHLARSRFLAGDPRGRTVLVLAGTGGNGAAAWSARAAPLLGRRRNGVALRARVRLADVTRHQLTILELMRVPTHTASEEVALSAADLIIDSLIGYSLIGTASWTSGRPHTQGQ